MNIKQKIGSWLVKSLDLNEMLSFFRRENGTENNGDGKVTRPYSQVELVYICLSKLINSVAGLNLIISTIDDKVVESGPVIDLLFNTKELSWQKIVQDWVGHWVLNQDVFIIYTDIAADGVAAFQIVSGTQMRPLTSNGTMSGTLMGWEYQGLYGERKRLDISQVHQTKNFNPYNKFHGLSPLLPAANSIDYSHAAALYNASALQNGAEPGPIFTLEGSPDETKIRAFLDSFESRHAGAKNTKRACALSGVKSVETIAQSMADLQVAEISKMSDTKICTIFGVPPELVGLGTEAQYSHGPAQRAFMFYTVLPLAKLFADELTASVINKFYPSSIRAVEFGSSKMFSGVKFKPVNRTGYLFAKQKAIQTKQQLFAWFDVDQCPAIEEAKRESTEKILGFTNNGITLNNLIQVHDLPYDEVPWGNDHFISPALMPARWIIDAGPGMLTEPLLPEGGTPDEPTPPAKSAKSASSVVEIEKASEIRKLRIWNNWKNSWVGIEKEYAEAIRKIFLREQRELLEKLQAAMTGKKQLKYTDADSDEIIGRVVLDLKKENDKIKVTNQIFFDKASELGIRQIAVQVGLTGDALKQFVESTKRNVAIRRALLMQSENLKGISRVTQRMVANQLKTGLEAGEGLNELATRIKEVLGNNLTRARGIARTQTGGAVSSGRHVSMKEAGIELKSWLSSKDAGVRETHKDADKRYAKGIPLDEPFVVGGCFLMHPGDPGGSIGEIANCRCVELAIKIGNKVFNLEYYETQKFYSYEDMQKAAKGA